jgi:hypothetical protein
MLTAEQRDAYQTKGFVAVHGLIDDPALLAELREAYDRELRSPDSGFHNIAAPSTLQGSARRQSMLVRFGREERQAPEPGGEVNIVALDVKFIKCRYSSKCTQSDTYDHSCFLARSNVYQHLMTLTSTPR